MKPLPKPRPKPVVTMFLKPSFVMLAHAQGLQVAVTAQVPTARSDRQS